MNYQHFNLDSFDKGYLNDFLRILLLTGNDIHIHLEDENGIAVEWDSQSLARFELIDLTSEEVGCWINLDDGSRQFIPRNNQEEFYQNWLKEHPEYKR